MHVTSTLAMATAMLAGIAAAMPSANNGDGNVEARSPLYGYVLVIEEYLEHVANAKSLFTQPSSNPDFRSRPKEGCCSST